MNKSLCRNCEGEFEAGINSTNQVYCSPKCRDEFWNNSRRNDATSAEFTEKHFGKVKELTLTNVEAAWLAALIDGEGTISIYRERRPANVAGIRFSACVQINNTSLELMTRISSLLPGWLRTEKAKPGHKVVYRFQLGRRYIKQVMQLLFPHLIIKKSQCAIAWNFCNERESGSFRGHENHELFDQMCIEIQNLNRRGSRD